MNMQKVTDTLATRRQPSLDRATRHADTLARGRQQSAGDGIRRQTQFHADYRAVSADDRQGQGRAEKRGRTAEKG